ncbi:MAG: hypothetical protein IJ083_06025 [Clostridia bacterium]|nr:hypothetical protein [Clostridia bacterium]
MDMTHMLDLAYSYLDAKIWIEYSDYELFAIRLPSGNASWHGGEGDDMGYCLMAGRQGQHISLNVYLGLDGLRGFRKVASGFRDTPEDVMRQNMAQLIFEYEQCRVQAEEMEAIRAYCKKSGRAFMAPFPVFRRYRTNCIYAPMSAPEDWAAIEKALLVTERMHGKTKKQLGFHMITFSKGLDTMIRDGRKIKAAIPFLSIEDGEVMSEPYVLPPYTEGPFRKPDEVSTQAIQRMLQNPQRGELHCRIGRGGTIVDVNPPYMPAVLVCMSDDCDPVDPVVGIGPEYDPNQMLSDFIRHLGDIYPERILVQNEETETLLKDFCHKAGIQIEMDENLDDVNEVFLRQTAKKEPTMKDMNAVMSIASVEELKLFPRHILALMYASKAELSPEVVEKLEKVLDIK